MEISTQEQAGNWAQTVKSVAVIGAGTMGEGIAQSLAEAGISVLLLDVDQASLDRCMAQIQANLRLAGACGIETGPVAETLNRIAPIRSENPAASAVGVEAVIETVPETQVSSVRFLRNWMNCQTMSCSAATPAA